MAELEADVIECCSSSSISSKCMNKEEIPASTSSGAPEAAFVPDREGDEEEDDDDDWMELEESGDEEMDPSKLAALSSAFSNYFLTPKHKSTAKVNEAGDSSMPYSPQKFLLPLVTKANEEKEEYIQAFKEKARKSIIMGNSFSAVEQLASHMLMSTQKSERAREVFVMDYSDSEAEDAAKNPSDILKLEQVDIEYEPEESDLDILNDICTGEMSASKPCRDAAIDLVEMANEAFSMDDDALAFITDDIRNEEVPNSTIGGTAPKEDYMNFASIVENLKMLGMQSRVLKEWPNRFESTWGAIDHSDFAAAVAMGLADATDRPTTTLDSISRDKQLLVDMETAWSELKMLVLLMFLTAEVKPFKSSMAVSFQPHCSCCKCAVRWMMRDNPFSVYCPCELHNDFDETCYGCLDATTADKYPPPVTHELYRHVRETGVPDKCCCVTEGSRFPKDNSLKVTLYYDEPSAKLGNEDNNPVLIDLITNEYDIITPEYEQNTPVEHVDFYRSQHKIFINNKKDVPSPGEFPTACSICRCRCRAKNFYTYGIVQHRINQILDNFIQSSPEFVLLRLQSLFQLVVYRLDARLTMLLEAFAGPTYIIEMTGMLGVIHSGFYNLANMVGPSRESIIRVSEVLLCQAVQNISGKGIERTVIIPLICMMIVNGEVEKAPTLYMLRFFSMSMSYLKLTECKPRLYRYRYERDMEVEQIIHFFTAIRDRYLPRMLAGIFSPDDPSKLYHDNYKSDISIDRRPTGIFKLPVVPKNESEALKKFLKGGYIRENMNSEQPSDVIVAVFFSNITSPERWAEFVSLISEYCGDDDKTFDETRLNEAVIKQDMTISSDTPDCSHGNIFLGPNIEPSLILTISKLLGSQDLIIRDKASEIFRLLLNCRLEAYFRRRLGIVAAEPETKPNILKTYHTAIEMTLISKACVGVLSSMITVDKKCSHPQKDIVFNFVTEIMSINGRLSIEPSDDITYKDFEKDEALITLLRAFSYSVFAIQSEHLGNFNDFPDPDLASARLTFLGEHISACGKKLNEIDYGESVPPEEMRSHSSAVRWPHLHIDSITGTIEEFIKLLPSDATPQLIMSESPALHYILRLLLDVHLELSILMFNTLLPNRKSVEFAKTKNFSVPQVQVVLTLITQIEQMLPLNEFMRTVLLDKKSIKQEDDLRNYNTATHLINALQSYLTDRFPKADFLGFFDSFEARSDYERKKSADNDEYSSSPKKRKIMKDLPNKLIEMISEFKAEMNKTAENNAKKSSPPEETVSCAGASAKTDGAAKIFSDCSKSFQDNVYNLTPETVKQLKEVRSASLKNRRHLSGKRKNRKEPLSKSNPFDPLHVEDPTKEEVMKEVIYRNGKRKLKKDTFEKELTSAAISIMMRKFVQALMSTPLEVESGNIDYKDGEVINGCDINDFWDKLVEQFPIWKLRALQQYYQEGYYQEGPACYRDTLSIHLGGRGEQNLVKLGDSPTRDCSADAVKKQAVKKSVANKSTFDKSLLPIDWNPEDPDALDLLSFHPLVMNSVYTNLLKKNATRDEWLFTMKKIQSLEKELSESTASPSKTAAADIREAERLAGRGLSKLIGHHKPAKTEEAATSSASSKCKCPHSNNLDSGCKDFNIDEFLRSRCELISKDAEVHMKNLKNQKGGGGCYSNPLGVLEDIGKLIVMNMKGETSKGASTASSSSEDGNKKVCCDKKKPIKEIQLADLNYNTVEEMDAFINELDEFEGTDISLINQEQSVFSIKKHDLTGIVCTLKATLQTTGAKLKDVVDVLKTVAITKATKVPAINSQQIEKSAPTKKTTSNKPEEPPKEASKESLGSREIIVVDLKLTNDLEIDAYIAQVMEFEEETVSLVLSDRSKCTLKKLELVAMLAVLKAALQVNTPNVNTLEDVFKMVTINEQSHKELHRRQLEAATQQAELKKEKSVPSTSAKKVVKEAIERKTKTAATTSLKTKSAVPPKEIRVANLNFDKDEDIDVYIVQLKTFEATEVHLITKDGMKITIRKLDLIIMLCMLKVSLRTSGGKLKNLEDVFKKFIIKKEPYEIATVNLNLSQLDATNLHIAERGGHPGKNVPAAAAKKTATQRMKPMAARKGQGEDLKTVKEIRLSELKLVNDAEIDNYIAQVIDFEEELVTLITKESVKITLKKLELVVMLAVLKASQQMCAPRTRTLEDVFKMVSIEDEQREEEAGAKSGPPAVKKHACASQPSNKAPAVRKTIRCTKEIRMSDLRLRNDEEIDAYMNYLDDFEGVDIALITKDQTRHSISKLGLIVMLCTLKAALQTAGATVSTLEDVFRKFTINKGTIEEEGPEPTVPPLPERYTITAIPPKRLGLDKPKPCEKVKELKVKLPEEPPKEPPQLCKEIRLADLKLTNDDEIDLYMKQLMDYEGDDVLLITKDNSQHSLKKLEVVVMLCLLRAALHTSSSKVKTLEDMLGTVTFPALRTAFNDATKNSKSVSVGRDSPVPNSGPDLAQIETSNQKKGAKAKKGSEDSSKCNKEIRLANLNLTNDDEIDAFIKQLMDYNEEEISLVTKDHSKHTLKNIELIMMLGLMKGALKSSESETRMKTLDDFFEKVSLNKISVAKTDEGSDAVQPKAETKTANTVKEKPVPSTSTKDAAAGKAKPMTVGRKNGPEVTVVNGVAMKDGVPIKDGITIREIIGMREPTKNSDLKHNKPRCDVSPTDHHHKCHANHSSDSCSSEEGRCSHQSRSNGNNSSDHPCGCCYCAVFGHAPAMTTPVPKNYNEARERLRSILNRKKQRCRTSESSQLPDAEVQDNQKNCQTAAQQAAATMQPGPSTIPQQQATARTTPLRPPPGFPPLPTGKPPVIKKSPTAESCTMEFTLEDIEAEFETSTTLSNDKAIEEMDKSMKKMQIKEQNQSNVSKTQAVQTEKPETATPKPQLVQQQQQQQPQQQQQQQQAQKPAPAKSQAPPPQPQGHQSKMMTKPKSKIMQQQKQEISASTASTDSRDSSIFSTSSVCSGWMKKYPIGFQDLNTVLKFIEGPGKSVDKAKKQAKKQRQKAKKLVLEKMEIRDQVFMLTSEMTKLREESAAISREIATISKKKNTKKGKKQKTLSEAAEEKLKVLYTSMTEVQSLVDSVEEDISVLKQRLWSVQYALQKLNPDDVAAATKAVSQQGLLGNQTEKDKQPQQQQQQVKEQQPKPEVSIQAANEQGMVTIKRVMLPDREEPSVTITARGSDKPIYTFQQNEGKTSVVPVQQQQEQQKKAQPSWESTLAQIHALAQPAKQKKPKEKKPEKPQQENQAKKNNKQELQTNTRDSSSSVQLSRSASIISDASSVTTPPPSASTKKQLKLAERQREEIEKALKAKQEALKSEEIVLSKKQLKKAVKKALEDLEEQAEIAKKAQEAKKEMENAKLKDSKAAKVSKDTKKPNQNNQKTVESKKEAPVKQQQNKATVKKSESQPSQKATAASVARKDSPALKIVGKQVTKGSTILSAPAPTPTVQMHKPVPSKPTSQSSIRLNADTTIELASANYNKDNNDKSPQLIDGLKMPSGPVSCSIMEQLRLGVQVADLKLPPGITLTWVDPAKQQANAQMKAAIPSMKLTDTPAPPCRPTPPVVNPPALIMVDTARLHQDQNNQQQNFDSDSKKGKKTKKKSKSKVLGHPPTGVTSTHSNPNMPKPAEADSGSRMVTLRNPMFHPTMPVPAVQTGPLQPQGAIQSKRSVADPSLRIPEPIPMPPNACQATITPTSNGMFTIRNPLMSMVHQQNMMAMNNNNNTQKPPETTTSTPVAVSQPATITVTKPQPQPDLPLPEPVNELVNRIADLGFSPNSAKKSETKSEEINQDRGYSLFKTADRNGSSLVCQSLFSSETTIEPTAPSPIGSSRHLVQKSTDDHDSGSRLEPIGPPLVKKNTSSATTTEEVLFREGLSQYSAFGNLGQSSQQTFGDGSVHIWSSPLLDSSSSDNLQHNRADSIFTSKPDSGLTENLSSIQNSSQFLSGSGYNSSAAVGSKPQNSWSNFPYQQKQYVFNQQQNYYNPYPLMNGNRIMGSMYDSVSNSSCNSPAETMNLDAPTASDNATNYFGQRPFGTYSNFGTTFNQQPDALGMYAGFGGTPEKKTQNLGAIGSHRMTGVNGTLNKDEYYSSMKY